MRKLILIVFFAISSLVIFAQVVPTKTLRIANANTAFGSNISVGDHIFDIATKTLYVSEIGIPSTGMISNNMLNLTKVNAEFNYTWAATAIETGYKTATFTHSLSDGHIGAYRIGTSNAVTLNITNLSDGDNGTIFLEMTTAPSTLIVAGYTGGVGTGATTEIVIGNTVTPTTGKHLSITYTYIGNGTSPFLYLVYGTEK